MPNRLIVRIHTMIIICTILILPLIHPISLAAKLINPFYTSITVKATLTERECTNTTGANCYATFIAKFDINSLRATNESYSISSAHILVASLMQTVHTNNIKLSSVKQSKFNPFETNALKAYLVSNDQQQLNKTKYKTYKIFKLDAGKSTLSINDSFQEKRISKRSEWDKEIIKDGFKHVLIDCSDYDCCLWAAIVPTEKVRLNFNIIMPKKFYVTRCLGNCKQLLDDDFGRELKDVVLSERVYQPGKCCVITAYRTEDIIYEQQNGLITVGKVKVGAENCDCLGHTLGDKIKSEAESEDSIYFGNYIY
ncbi:hypothetical protein GJ496_001554 [Pomphorhynchus laevis]|nr:hypothetical protein GJ496_001554 [Pomphorhynchus laevis]